MKKRLIILGATGSVGRSALDVLETLRDEWTLVGLAAGSNGTALAEQANHFRPDVLAIARDDVAATLESSLDYAPTLFCGEESLVQLVARFECDCVLSAVVGTGGLEATLRAVELGRRVALANKEALVIAGSLLVPLARRHGAEIIPVDSEHSAIFQALHAGRREEVKRVHLTASGGPFRTADQAALASATPEAALRHPTWTMGPKITIDSATMMNKALEIVEARWLFDLDPDQIQVVIHPESIIHALVEFCDGSLVAQLGSPDMRIPIQYALTYPQRRPGPSMRLDLSAVQQLNFHAPDPGRFPALRLGYEVARRGGTAGAVLNAANETAVQMFREGALRFPDVTRVTERALAKHVWKQSPTLDDLLAADQWARDEVARCVTC